MKPRAVGLMAFFLAALPLAGSLLWFQMAYNESQIPVMRRSALTQLPTIPISDPGDLVRMEHLMTRMALLSEPMISSRKRINLALFGQVTLPTPSATNSHPESEVKDKVAHTVSMAFITPSSRFAVVDGALHGEGDILNDGSIIARIEAKQILLRSQDVQETWLFVKDNQYARGKGDQEQ